MKISARSMSCTMALVVASWGAAVCRGAEAVPGSDWESYNKTPEGQRYSPLDEINVANAATLTEVCRVPVAELGSLQAGPVVIGDSLYVTTPADTFSIDPVTCHIKWRTAYYRSVPPGLPVNRGVAYLNGRIFRGTDDGRLLALDALTGAQIWTSIAGDATLGEYISGAPLAWNGLVIVGIAGGEFGIRGRILAYDALSGREVWRFNTIPQGSEQGAQTWGNSKWAAHGGGASWSTFSIDPTSAELFAPIGNPVPDLAPQDRPGSNLFTDSAVVLDARTGQLRWWYQLQANDDRDYDLAAAPMLFRNARHEDMMAAAGKDGLLHIVDRASHQVRFKVPVTTVDPVHRPMTEQPLRACPGPAGGVLWNGPAFDPRRMTIFVGADDLCMTLKSTSASAYVPRGLNLGGSVVPGKDVASGWLTAVDADTGQVRWKYHADTPVLGGVTPTAGGIVLAGDNGGDLLIFDSGTGRLLLQRPSGGALAGGIVTYAREGKQYVAFTSGNVSPASFGSVGRPSVVVMSLPGKPQPSTSAADPDAARGAAVYTQACSGCHGPDGSRVAGKDLKALSAQLSADALAAYIRAPTGQMPKIFPEPRSAQDERNVRDVVAYLGTWH
jgi:alcohol dehydrogenase (cytochrome c)